ncbi:MAG: glutathione S-transferase family protein [Motiliproteus sp.]
MPTLVIGNKNYSSWSLRPWLVLKHLGIGFDEIQLELDTPAFKKQINLYSEAGRVPVLVVNKLKIWDSLAICEYLAEEHPHLWPDDRHARALARAITCELHSGFSALRNELPMNCRAQQRQIEISAEAQCDLERIEQLWQQCSNTRTPEQNRAGPWLFGRFGIIDAFFAPVVIRLQGYRLSLSENSVAYVEHQLNNPLLQTWIRAGQAETTVLPHEEAGEVE